MLIELQVENFRSFRDRQRFSMVASSDTTREENTVTVPALGKQRLLRSAVVYGPNAAGKSNLIHALSFIRDFVTNSLFLRSHDPIPVQPFRLDQRNRAAPSSFEVTFISDGVRFQYGFRIDRQRVHEEWLLAYPKRVAQQWFHRTQSNDGGTIDWYFGPNLRGDKERIANLTKPESLFLTTAVQFSQPQLQPVYDWFANGVRVIESAHLESEETLEGFNAELIDDFPLARDTFEHALRIADLGITGIEITREPPTEASIPSYLPPEMRQRIAEHSLYTTQMRHSTADDTEKGVLFPIEDESLGTRRFYRLNGPLWAAIQAGWLLAVDELDASLHPELVRWIVALFHVKAQSRRPAQLLFNTHDTTLLDADILRRDQVWFVEKDRGGASHLYPLLDYSPRKNEALGKSYLQGRYGAIPFIGGDLTDILNGEQTLATAGARDNAEE